MDRKKETLQNNIVIGLLAVLIDLKIISQGLWKYFNTSDGFFSTVMMICYIIFAVVSAYGLIRNGFKVSAYKLAVIYTYVLLLAGWYFISAKVTATSWLQLVAYAFIPPMIVLQINNLNAKKLLFFVMLISVALLPTTSYVLVVDYRNSIDMDVAYAFLPGIIAAIVHFAFFRKKSHKAIYLLYAIQIYYGINILQYGVRGPIACIIVTILLIIYCGPKKKKAPLAGLIIGILVLVGVIFLEDIIQGLINLGLDWYFLKKNATLVSAGNILHGRDGLSALAMSGFLDSPIWGNGVNSFLYYTGYGYPHNIITQLLFEGGILIFGVFVILFITAVHKLYQEKNTNDLIAFVFLTPTCFVYYLLSSNVWSSPLFWIYIGFLFYIIGKNIRYKQKSFQ